MRGAPLKVVAVHGLPTSPRLWERLALGPGWELCAPAVPGLGPEGTPADWSLEGCAEALAVETSTADVLVGHDLGGVLCAMMARPGQAVVLSGTALGVYWWAVRGTAMPLVQRWFYQRYGGQRFLARGCLPEQAASLLAAFGEHGPGWPDRMRRIALAMKPPRHLGRRLQSCSVQLVWGLQDPWYPPVVARSLQRSTGGRIEWLSCGHFAPWESPRRFSELITRAEMPNV